MYNLPIQNFLLKLRVYVRASLVPPIKDFIQFERKLPSFKRIENLTMS